MKTLKTQRRPKIGFIGQGWIGRHYADDFERRGYDIVRYSKEEPYLKNREAVSKCDIVFIAVPTPTTPKGFDASILRKVLPLVGKGKIAVIKSTIVPGTTKKMQKAFPGIFLFHSPEFLREANAKEDTEHPDRNIVGIPSPSKEYEKKARLVLSVLPKAPFELVCDSNDAELVKYGGNCFLYVKVVFMNMMYDLSRKQGGDFRTIALAMSADPRIGTSHMNPVHQSGRGAGGHCFIKDFAAFADLYEKSVRDRSGAEVLRSLEKKNGELLRKSGKDRDLLFGVYGE